MATDRRQFLTGLAAGCVAAALPRVPLAAPGVRYLTAARNAADGGYLSAALDAAGGILWERALPARGHDAAVRPGHDICVVMARRPGRFACVLDISTGRLLQKIDAIDGRHFYGHAVFSPDGRFMFATENAFETGAGVIGVYDADAGYRRVGEYASGAMDPHQIALMPDGHSLVVANGGIRTHPDRGRETLNPDEMHPALTYIDMRSGALLARIGLDGKRENKLSMHHLTVFADGTVAVGCQDQGPVADGLPVVFVHRPGGTKAEFLEMPATMLAALDGYCGSVSATPDGGVLAVSSPKGGLVAFWSMPDTRFIGVHALADVCGLATAADGMLITSGLGAVDAVTPGRLGRRRHASHADRQWDNHVRVV